MNRVILDRFISKIVNFRDVPRHPARRQRFFFFGEKPKRFLIFMRLPRSIHSPQSCPKFVLRRLPRSQLASRGAGNPCVFGTGARSRRVGYRPSIVPQSTGCFHSSSERPGDRSSLLKPGHFADDYQATWQGRTEGDRDGRRRRRGALSGSGWLARRATQRHRKGDGG